MSKKFYIVAIPSFSDNYIWALINPELKLAWVIDPGDPEPVIIYIQQHQLTLQGILVTHNHWDHTWGIKKLNKKFTLKNVYCSRYEKIDYSTEHVDENSTIILDDYGLKFSILHIPGHTLGHIAYYSDSNGVLFCGDTLFSAGCGRLFESTAAVQMYNSLKKISKLPKETKIYPAHEYTLKNLNFAKTIEPHNRSIIQHIERVKELRINRKPSLPTNLNLEQQINPFLRCHRNEVIEAAEIHSGHKYPLGAKEVFSVIRSMKDNF